MNEVILTRINYIRSYFTPSEKIISSEGRQFIFGQHDDCIRFCTIANIQIRKGRLSETLVCGERKKKQRFRVIAQETSKVGRDKFRRDELAHPARSLGALPLAASVIPKEIPTCP